MPGGLYSLKISLETCKPEELPAEAAAAGTPAADLSRSFWASETTSKLLLSL